MKAFLFHCEMMPETLFTRMPFCQEAKYTAFSHEELAATFLQSEISIHGHTWIVRKYFQKEALGCPDTVQEKEGDSRPSSKTFRGPIF